eukprot:5883377-Amphidinium_carterae.1
MPCTICMKRSNGDCPLESGMLKPFTFSKMKEIGRRVSKYCSRGPMRQNFGGLRRSSACLAC